MLRRALAFAALGLLLCIGTALAALAPVPPLTARVIDQTGTLDAAQVQSMEATLAAFEQAKGSQIAVLVVASTGDETIEQYSIRVVDAWKLGRKGIDDGALLLVAKDDHKVRIEVGRGLEGVIPDAIANRIIAEDVTPLFRKGDFAGGVRAGIERMIGLVNGEALPPPNPRAGHGSGSGNEPWVVFGMVAFLTLRALLSRMSAIPRGSIIGGVVFIVGLLYGLAFLYALGLAALAFVFTLPTRDGSGSYAGGGGWSGGSSGGGGFGGFSGGGGGFSGGGASGGW